MILIIGTAGKPTGEETFSRRTSNYIIVLSVLPNTGLNPTLSPKGKCGARVRWRREERCRPLTGQRLALTSVETGHMPNWNILSALV